MGKRSPGPMSYIREASALRNIKLCYAGRSFSIRVVIRCLRLTNLAILAEVRRQTPQTSLLADLGRFFSLSLFML